MQANEPLRLRWTHIHTGYHPFKVEGEGIDLPYVAACVTVYLWPSWEKEGRATESNFERMQLAGTSYEMPVSLDRFQ